MIDKKVYKTDYESEFTEFFNSLSGIEEPESVDVVSEIKKYSKIDQLRDNAGKSNSRDKLWEGF